MMVLNSYDHKNDGRKKRKNGTSSKFFTFFFFVTTLSALPFSSSTFWVMSQVFEVDMVTKINIDRRMSY